jgi:hypothetical protein
MAFVSAEPPGIDQSLEYVTPPSGAEFIRWHGKPGRTYFVQVSDSNTPLEKWSWAPIIESGNNQNISYEVDGTASRGFFRLHYTDTTPPAGVTLENWDADGDSLSNTLELSLQANPLNSDTNGDGIPDGWAHAHGQLPAANIATGLFNGGPATNLQAYQQGVQANPNATIDDHDGDLIDNEDDADPENIDVDWKRANVGGYALIEIETPTGAGNVRDFNDAGHVLFTGGVWKAGTWTPFADLEISGSVIHDEYELFYETVDQYGMRLSPQGAVLEHTNIFYTHAFGFNDMLHTVRTAYSPATNSYGSSVTTFDTLEWAIQGHGLVSYLALGEDAAGRIFSYKIFSPSHPDDPEPEICILDSNLGQTSYLQLPEGCYLYMDGDQVTPSGWLAVNAVTYAGNTVTDRTIVWNPAGQEISTAGGLPLYFSGLTELPHGKPALICHDHGTNDSVYLLNQTEDAFKPAAKLSGKNIRTFAGDGTAITADGKMWINGELMPLRDLCPAFGELLDEGWFIHVQKANKHGSYLLIACNEDPAIVRPEQQTGVRPHLLAPLSFINPRGPVHDLQISDCAPRIALDVLQNTSVSISGSQASIQISGDVFDPITAILPPGTADLTSLRVYLNGTKLSTSGNLQRQSADLGVWKPYGDKFTISPFTVFFPAGGTNLIRIETPPNAAGMVGKAEFEVNFRTDVTPRPPIPAYTIEQDIILSGPLDTEAEDTVQIAAVNEAPSLTLTETDDDTGVFVSTQGHSFVMSKTFTVTQSADALPCSLMLPGSPMSSSMQGRSGQCVETGPETLRFRYMETIPGRPQDSTLSEVLNNVQMHPIPNERDGWFPIILKMGAELEGLKLEWFGKEFPIRQTSNGVCATTHDDKPLVGVIVKRSEEPTDPEQDPPPPVLEFMYYDHTEASIVRVPLDENLGTHEWKLMQDSQELYVGELPLKQISFVNADGSLAAGILPLPIETLQAILEGDAPEIGPDQYAFIELRGHIDGEVVRFGNEEAPFDYYDLIAGEEETILQEGPRHVRLEKLADRKFRSTQKVVIYGTSDTSQQELTQSQWLVLRDAGYLAIHNPDKKVFWGKEDIEWLTSERGSFHPPAGTKMGIAGVMDPTKLDFYRFEGFDDHHIFNKFHGANGSGRALAWSKLFEGENFDVDEFTVPVRKGVHRKIQHLADKGWRSFIDEVFDATTGELKPGITGKVLAQKRGQAFALMGTLVEEMGLELKWVRPYPKGVLASQIARPGLYNRLVDSNGALGESINRLGSLSNKFLKALGSTATDEGQRLFKKHVKQFLKAGGKGAVKCLPLVFAYQSHASTHRMLLDTMSFGPKEGAARHLDYSLELQDLPLARNIVNQNWEMFEDLIAGADGKLCAELPSGTAIKVGDPTFFCDFDAYDKIVHITPYVITNIWQFPDGRVKVKAKMTREPYSTLVNEDTEWYITDWYPAIGEKRADWQEACRRAGAFNDYGDP